MRQVELDQTGRRLRVRAGGGGLALGLIKERIVRAGDRVNQCLAVFIDERHFESVAHRPLRLRIKIERVVVDLQDARRRRNRKRPVDIGIKRRTFTQCERRSVDRGLAVTLIVNVCARGCILTPMRRSAVVFQTHRDRRAAVGIRGGRERQRATG